MQAVHPRRRGEHIFAQAFEPAEEGSSPQARGTLPFRSSWLRYLRFIPAGAGNTSGCSRAPVAVSVHPRRRGEHATAANAVLTAIGSSPQARGTHDRGLYVEDDRRFIPAGAGNTDRARVCARYISVHPRRRGEHDRRIDGTHSYIGSSPQARGTRLTNTSSSITNRFIPAGAGNTRHQLERRQQSAVHPRRRGEHQSSTESAETTIGSSPQARGTLPTRFFFVFHARFIPAGAGNTP